MTFTEELKELNEILAETITAQYAAIQRIKERYEREVMEQQSDLENALEDLENEKDLNFNLKKVLDGRKE